MSLFVILLSAGFPIFIWLYGWEFPKLAAIYLAVILVARFFSIQLFSKPAFNKQLPGEGETHNSGARLSDILLLIGGLIICVALLLGIESVGLYYPVLVNGVLFVVFSTSLLSPPGVIERLARRQEKEHFDEISQRYTHNLTKIWCVFFILNGAVCFYLAYYEKLEWWTLYTGFLSYGLIGLLLGLERILRGGISTRMRLSRASGRGQ